MVEEASLEHKTQQGFGMLDITYSLYIYSSLIFQSCTVQSWKSSLGTGVLLGASEPHMLKDELYLASG